MKIVKTGHGIALVVVLLCLSLLSVVALGVTYLGSSSLQQIRGQEKRDIALYAAEAGLNQKLQELKNDDVADIAGSIPTTGATYQAVVYESGEIPPGTSLTVPAGGFYYILATGSSGTNLRRKIGMLVRKSTSAFNVAVLAKKQIQFKEGSYTDTYDSTDPFATFDHSLATVGITDPAGEVEFSPDTFVGNDGTRGIANVIGPTGSDESLIKDGVEGLNYKDFVKSSLLSDPEPIPGRSFGTVDAKAVSPGDEIVLTPVLDGGEYVIKRKALEVKDGGRIVLDISGVPDGEKAHFDFEKIVMEGGEIVLEVGSSNAVCEFYVGGNVDIKGGSIINETQRPERFQFFLSDKVSMELDTAAYFVARAKQFQLQGGEIYGSVVASDQIALEKGSVIHYDQSLTDSVTSSSPVLLQISFQRF